MCRTLSDGDNQKRIRALFSNRLRATTTMAALINFEGLELGVFKKFSQFNSLTVFSFISLLGQCVHMINTMGTIFTISPHSFLLPAKDYGIDKYTNLLQVNYQLHGTALQQYYRYCLCFKVHIHSINKFGIFVKLLQGSRLNQQNGTQESSELAGMGIELVLAVQSVAPTVST